MTDAQLHVLLEHVVERLDAGIAAAEDALPDDLSRVPETPKFLKAMEPFLQKTREYPALSALYDLSATLHDELELLARAFVSQPASEPKTSIAGKGPSP